MRRMLITLLSVAPAKSRGRGRPLQKINLANKDAVTIANNMRRYRKLRGCSVQQAAALTNIKPAHWYEIERANVTFRTPEKTLTRIAAALYITLEQLKGRKNNVIYPTREEMQKIRKAAERDA